MTKIRDICRDMEKDGFEHPTLFEIETAMAFLYFRQEKCHLSFSRSVWAALKILRMSSHVRFYCDYFNQS